MWLLPKYRLVIEDLVREQARPQHKLGHQPRLYALCQRIGESIPHDDEIVFAAAWLHDLGVFEGNRPSDLKELAAWNHVEFACREITRVLAATDFPRSKISRVVAVVEEHQPHNEPRSIESTIVRDADILEQLGAIGILRSAAKLGSDTRFSTFSDVERYLDHQLKVLPGSLRLEGSRQLATEKIETLSRFLCSLREEALANLG